MTFSEKSISFQLTPSRRATLVPYNDFEEKVFQLTPSRRATEQLLAENEQLIISTHALTEGDPLYQDSDENYQAFQLTPSRRATANLDKFFF